MSLNRFISRFLRRRPQVKHWWREQGEANCFRIVATVTEIDGYKRELWVMAVQLNGTMSLSAQQEVMARMCWALDLKS